MKQSSTIRTLAAVFVLIGFLTSSIGNRLYGKEPAKLENPVSESTQEGNPEKQVSDNQGKKAQVEIWLQDITTPLITAGFWLRYNPSQTIISEVEVFDDSDLPGPWDHTMTKKLANPNGSGTYLLAVGNLANVTPDKNNEIKLAQVRFRCKEDCDEPITITTIKGFDTVVGDEGHVYDSGLTPFSFIINY